MLDASRATSLGRTRRRRSVDRIESEGDEFFERVRLGYQERAKNDPGRFRVIDASPDLETVAAETEAVVADAIGRWTDQQ